MSVFLEVVQLKMVGKRVSKGMASRSLETGKVEADGLIAVDSGAEIQRIDCSW